MFNPHQKYLLVFFFTIFGVFGLAAKSSNMDSLRQELEQAKSVGNWEKVAENSYLLGNILRKAEKHLECIDICLRIVDQAKEQESTYMMGDIMYLLAFSHRRLNKYEVALDYSMKMIEMPEECFKYRSVEMGYNNLALIYKDLGDFQKAYGYSVKALRVYETAKDSIKIVRTVYGIGSILYDQKNYKNALDSYQKALALSEQLYNDKAVYSCLAAIASVYIETEEFEKALEYNQRSLKIAEKASYKSGIAYAMHNIGSTYLGMKDYAKAKEHFLHSVEIKQATSDKWGLIQSYKTLGECAVAMGKHKESIDFLGKAQDLAHEIGSRTLTIGIYEIFAISYEESGNAKMANQYLKKFIALKDSVFTETSLKEMGNVKTQYEVQKREDEIALLTTEKALLEKEQKIKSLNFYLMGGSLIFFLVLTLIWFSRFRMQKRLVGLLEEKNDQIHYQNKQLESSNEDLQQFAYVASHDLKEPLRMISSYTTLLKKRYNQLFDDQAHEFMFYVVDAVDRMQTLLDDLLAYSRVETQGGNKRWVESSDILTMVTSNLRAAIEEKSVSIKVHYDQLPQINADSSQMVQLFQNLMSNAIKFVDTDEPEVEVGFKTAKGKTAFYVKDNGIGIDEKSKEKIFEMFHRLHTRDEFEGTGIGLATCKRIVDRHMGEIWVESERGEGSTFFIAFPEKAITNSEIAQKPALVG